MSLISKLMMKLIYFLGLVLVISCKHSTTSAPDLEFNQAIHYTISIDDDTLFDLASRDGLTDYEQLKIEVLLNKTPESLSDTLLLENFGAIGFTKTQLNTEQVSQLQYLFNIEHKKPVRVNECINIYRDILVLRQGNKTIGIAKICLECEAMLLTAAEQQNLHLRPGNYERLKDLMMK